MTLTKKITEALSRPVCGGWDHEFLESILNQLSKERPLSSKQKQALGKVLARNTAEDQKNHEGWSKIYKKEYKADAFVLAAYHTRQPYYKAMASDILIGRVPERSKFLRMYDNKYSKKVLREYAKEARYSKDAHVMPRATFSAYKGAEMENVPWSVQADTIEKFKKRGGFIMEIKSEIYSHAKGSKRYKILPIGSTFPLVIEERHLKLNRKKQQKSIQDVYAPKFQPGDFVKCVYDFVDFYKYIYEDLDEDDHTYYGIVLRIDTDFYEFMEEYIYEVLCVDGLRRHFMESEIWRAS